MSMSFVAGAEFNEEADTSMTLTFLSGPQAVSTPHGNRQRFSDNRRSNANTTFNVFKTAETGMCFQPGSSRKFDLTQSNTLSVEDKTCVLFNNIEAASNNKNGNGEHFVEFEVGGNTTFNAFKSAENAMNQFQHLTTVPQLFEQSNTISNGNKLNLQENTFVIMNNILGDKTNELLTTAVQNNETFNMVCFIIFLFL